MTDLEFNVELTAKNHEIAVLQKGFSDLLKVNASLLTSCNTLIAHNKKLMEDKGHLIAQVGLLMKPTNGVYPPFSLN